MSDATSRNARAGRFWPSARLDPPSDTVAPREAPLPAPAQRPATLSQPDQPFQACHTCSGRGYTLFSAGQWARARTCHCQGACQACKGDGYVLETSKQGYVFHAPCECRRARARLDAFNRALVPSHFTFKDLDNFERTEQTQHITDYVNTFARGYPADRAGLLLVGPPGVGKTHLVVSVLKLLTLDKGVPCLFKDFFLLLSEVKAAYQEGRFETQVLRPLTDVDVLVIDELGKGRSNSDWEQGLLDEIVCKRYNQMKTTLLTTNFPLDPPSSRAEHGPHGQRGANGFRPGLGNLSSAALIPTLEDRIGERIFSRLKQMCTLLRVEAADYRRSHSAGGLAGGRR